MAKSGRKAKNLLLAPEAISRGERYGARHGKNLSNLVSDFLQSLPLEEGTATLPPIVRRLHGVAAAGTADKQMYREHLRRKYAPR